MFKKILLLLLSSLIISSCAGPDPGPVKLSPEDKLKQELCKLFKEESACLNNKKSSFDLGSNFEIRKDEIPECLKTLKDSKSKFEKIFPNIGESLCQMPDSSTLEDIDTKLDQAIDCTIANNKKAQDQLNCNKT